MNKILSGVISILGNPMDFAVGMIFVFIGCITLYDGQIGIWLPVSDKVSWIDAFARLDNWFGWVLLWFGVDSFFHNKMTRFIIDKIFAPIFKNVISGILGAERLNTIKTKQVYNALKDYQGKGLVETIDGVDYRATNKLMNLIETDLKNDKEALIEEASNYDVDSG